MIPSTIQDGRVEFLLEGEKLKGAYALIYTGSRGRKFWLFFKMKELHRDTRDILTERPESVLSGKTIEELESKDETTLV